MDEQVLASLVAHKHDALPITQQGILRRTHLQIDDPEALNAAIIHTYCIVNSTSQHKFMTEFLIATIEELPSMHTSTIRWNVAETRYAILPELHHIFEKVLRQLQKEDYLYGSRFMRGALTEANLLTSKDSLIYRLEG